MKTYRPPTFEEERALIEKAQAGCIESRNALILGHFPFIVERTAKVVNRYHHRLRRNGSVQRVGRGRRHITSGNWGGEGGDVEEYIGHGVQAFINCIRGFDPAKAVGIDGKGRGRLLTYAGLSIERMLGREIRSRASNVKTPDKTNSKPGERRWEDPAYVEKVEAAHRPIRIGSLKCRGNTIRPMRRGWGGSELARAGEPDGGVVESVVERIDAREDVELVRGAIAALPERERVVLRARMDGRTLGDIGAQLGLCRERVRQIEMLAKKKVRAWMMGEGAEGG